MANSIERYHQLLERTSRREHNDVTCELCAYGCMSRRRWNSITASCMNVSCLMNTNRLQKSIHFINKNIYINSVKWSLNWFVSFSRPEINNDSYFACTRFVNGEETNYHEPPHNWQFVRGQEKINVDKRCSHRQRPVSRILKESNDLWELKSSEAKKSDVKR
jgi:hypothetical protein